jgi:hypothetical protein
MGEKLAAKDDELKAKDYELKAKDDEYLNEINNLKKENENLQNKIREIIQKTKTEGKNRQAGKENDHEEIGKLKQELKKYKEQLRKLLKTVKTKSKKSSEKIKKLQKRQKIVESKIQEDTLEWLAEQLSVITIENKKRILSKIKEIMNMKIPADWMRAEREKNYDGYDRKVANVICRVHTSNAKIKNCLLEKFYNFIKDDHNKDDVREFEISFINFYYKKNDVGRSLLFGENKQKSRQTNVDDLDREYIFRMILIQLLKPNVLSEKIMQHVVTAWGQFKNSNKGLVVNRKIWLEELKNERLQYNLNETNEKNSDDLMII